jgi:hypothetical protein
MGAIRTNVSSKRRRQGENQQVAADPKLLKIENKPHVQPRINIGLNGSDPIVKGNGGGPTKQNNAPVDGCRFCLLPQEWGKQKKEKKKRPREHRETSKPPVDKLDPKNRVV